MSDTFDPDATPEQPGPDTPPAPPSSAQPLPPPCSRDPRSALPRHPGVPPFVRLPAATRWSGRSISPTSRSARWFGRISPASERSRRLPAATRWSQRCPCIRSPVTPTRLPAHLRHPAHRHRREARPSRGLGPDDVWVRAPWGGAGFGGPGGPGSGRGLRWTRRTRRTRWRWRPAGVLAPARITLALGRPRTLERSGALGHAAHLDPTPAGTVHLPAPASSPWP